ncbi:MAG: hypothetical protein P1U67_06155 [Alcanivoracaceae bacterium]|nr:hypothetical protein [Alcanivoracaceae bacterium]
MKAETLLQEIQSVMPPVQKPVGIDICFHKDGCFECEALRREIQKFGGKELPTEGIREIHQDMSSLSAKGWRWALPSYLEFSLSEDASVRNTETEFLIYNLAPAPEHQAETKERLSELNREQIVCLLHFLEWCLNHEHWGQYCQEDIKAGIAFLSTISA